MFTTECSAHDLIYLLKTFRFTKVIKPKLPRDIKTNTINGHVKLNKTNSHPNQFNSLLAKIYLESSGVSSYNYCIVNGIIYNFQIKEQKLQI